MTAPAPNGVEGSPDPRPPPRHGREGQVLARHRSPSGARPEPGHAAPHPPGTHRLPPPPAATLRGRVTLAAVAAGAAVAGGQTFVSAFAAPPVVAAALLPVADSRDTAPGGTDAGLAGTDAIGADQLDRSLLRVGPLGGDLGSPGLDPRSAVDVHNLTKATDIGEQVAKR